MQKEASGLLFFPLNYPAAFLNTYINLSLLKIIKEMNRKEKALEFHKMGYNCAQAVLLAFYGENDPYIRIASGFGGGMGRLQKTCGAVTGAFMVIGLQQAPSGLPDDETKTKIYSLVRSFDKEFIRICGTDQCSELLGEDLNSEEGRKRIKEKGLSESVCDKCISTAVALLEK
jgi:C_GCAxxG_C_C family probable redox protein